MLRIAIIIGSTRPGRKGEVVAKWVYEIAQERSDAEFELVDIKDFNLPLLDEPVSPIMGQYSKPHTKVWAAKIASFDGYVFVTPEYNHGIAGALKNAIDFLFAEWNDKAAAFVSYGGAGGARAVEQLRLVLAEVQIATVRNQVLLSMFTDFENFSVFRPAPQHEKSVHAMFDQVIAWGGALKTLREKRAWGGAESTDERTSENIAFTAHRQPERRTTMPYLHLDLPSTYPVEVKRELATRLCKLYAEVMETQLWRPNVGIAELGKGNLYHLGSDGLEPITMVMVEFRRGAKKILKVL